MSQSTYSIQQVTEALLSSEAPHWDAHHQALFFRGITTNTIHKYVPATGKHTKSEVGGPMGFIVPVEGTTDQFLVGVERKFQIVKWDGENNSPATVVKEIAAVDQDVPTTRLNDGKADPRGRIFAGTIAPKEPLGTFEPEKGTLYRLDGTKVTKVVDGITLSNGMAWDLREKAMYYVDSLERNIRRYDYDVDTGEISNLRYIFDFDKNKIDGIPDGMTIDTNGNLWIAVFNGACVLNIDPRTGELLRKVSMPAVQVTSAAFGGPNYDILFVTTASLNIDGPQEPPCGAIFAVSGLGVKGQPNNNFIL